MKKTLSVPFLLLNTGAYAQGYSHYGNSSDNTVIIIIICIVIFFLIREVICWYYKINQMVNNQTEIIRLLKIIAGEKGIVNTQEKTPRPKNSSTKYSIGDKVFHNKTGRTFEIRNIKDGNYICYFNGEPSGSFSENELSKKTPRTM